VNDDFRDLKRRIRAMDLLLAERGAGKVEFAQAVSRVRRLARRGDRSREPSAELRAVLEAAEKLALTV
jgi:hypothetical protein